MSSKYKITVEIEAQIPSHLTKDEAAKWIRSAVLQALYTDNRIKASNLKAKGK